MQRPEKLINVDPELIIDTSKAARLLGVSDREVRAKIARGTLPAAKLGRKYYVNINACRVYNSIIDPKIRRKSISQSTLQTNQSSSLLSVDTITTHTNNPAPQIIYSDPFQELWSQFAGKRFRAWQD